MLTAVALTVACPRCDAQAGAMCTYVLHEGIRARPCPPDWYASPTVQKFVSRVGQVMQRCHNERYAAVQQREQAERKRQERERLSTWFATYGDIFKV